MTASVVPEFETLRVAVEGETATVTLCRPGKANAVNRRMLQELVMLADWLRDQPGIAYLVLTHDGKVFAAGTDLKEVAAELELEDRVRRPRMRSLQVLAQEMMTKLERLDQITIAALEGSAYGAGMAIAMTTDFRIMSEGASLVLPETALGMFLTFGCTPRLVATVGLSRAKRMIMWAEPLSAEDCLAWGLVDEVVPAGTAVATAQRWIDGLRDKDPRAVRLTKHLANASAPAAFGDVMMTEPALCEEVMGDGSIRPRLDRFLKR